MSLEEAVRQSRVIPQNRKESLISDVVRSDFKWLVANPHTEIERLQGDFMQSVPVCFLDKGEQVLCKRMPVMLISNSCDLVSNRSIFVNLAPVFDLSGFLAAHGKNNSNFADALRLNKIKNLFYIPWLSIFPGGAVVRLDMISSVPSSFIDEAVTNSSRFASFTQNGYYYLLMKLTHFLVRSESDEISRT